jgi:mannosyl-oligosaccharide alpha-1,2-mannosidase
MHDQLVKTTETEGLVFIGERVHGRFQPKMDHLVCFMPAVLALGARNGAVPNGEQHMTTAKRLLETCYAM